MNKHRIIRLPGLLDVAAIDIEITPIAFQNSNLLGQFVLFPVYPTDLFKEPPLAQVCSDNGMFVFIAWRYELVEESKEFVDLQFGEVSVVGCVLYFKSVEVLTSARHDIGQRVETWVADWNAYGMVAFLLE